MQNREGQDGLSDRRRVILLELSFDAIDYVRQNLETKPFTLLMDRLPALRIAILNAHQKLIFVFSILQLLI